MVPVTRGPAERVVGWLYMGPLGHAWSVIADLGELIPKWALTRARRRFGADTNFR